MFKASQGLTWLQAELTLKALLKRPHKAFEVAPLGDSLPKRAVCKALERLQGVVCPADKVLAVLQGLLRALGAIKGLEGRRRAVLL